MKLLVPCVSLFFNHLLALKRMVLELSSCRFGPLFQSLAIRDVESRRWYLWGFEQWCTLQWCMSVFIVVVAVVVVVVLAFFNSIRSVLHTIVSGVVIAAICSVAIWAGGSMLMACMSTAQRDVTSSLARTVTSVTQPSPRPRETRITPDIH